MSIFSVLLVAGLTLCTLFLAARWGDSARADGVITKYRGLVFGLSLGVYFTSWTFYGAVGSASMKGWDYLPIYLGPFIAFTVGFPIVRKLVKAGRDYGSTSIADFLSYRYGKSAGLAATASLIAVVGALPYIALQLTSIRESLEAVGISKADGTTLTGFFIATALALFAIMFGASSADVTRHNRGLVVAVAIETLLKLFALIVVAALALITFGFRPSMETLAAPYSPLTSDFDLPRFLILTALAFTAIFCLPRQFQVMVVECQDDADLTSGRWIMVAALIITALVVLPISAAGLNLVNGSAPADMYVLSLPMKLGVDSIALLAFAGGVAASTGMVIVAAVALSTMVTNDHVRAAQMHLNQRGGSGPLPSAARQVQLRRVVIVAILAAAYAFSEGVRNTDTLASLGLLAFASAGQFGPALFGGLYWSGANKQGAKAGLLAGFCSWFVLLALPAYGVETVSVTLLGMDSFASGVLASILINLSCFVVVSVITPAGVSEQVEARKLVFSTSSHKPTGTVTYVGDLIAVVEYSLGSNETKRAFASFERETRRTLRNTDPIDQHLAGFAERQIARVMGAASARIVISAILRGEHSSVADISVLLGDARDRRRFSHELLEATLENQAQGVCVIDADMRLTAWNRAYLNLFEYPDGMIQVGIPIEDIIRFNGRRGLAAAEDIEAYVAKRLTHYRSGSEHRFERPWQGNRVLEIEGNPLPGGGYVTTFKDITDARRAEEALQETAENLEIRVRQRTQELEEANQALEEAHQQAEEATQSKTRFLAAASHDLMQPLNAARLYAGALASDAPASMKPLVGKLDQAIGNADQLIRTLLNISKLDGGGLTPEVSSFALQHILDDLANEFEVQAEEKGLALTVMPTSLPGYTDRGLLFSVLQNFVSNAVRYTAEGRILIGCRPRGSFVEIMVVDTGPGIKEAEQSEIFKEFVRGKAGAEKGLGLGLAITKRIADLLETPIRLRSREGVGSAFSILVPVGDQCDASAPAASHMGGGDLSGLTVLCVDNDAAILDSERHLLERWGCTVLQARSVDEALNRIQGAHPLPDIMLLDYHLDDGETGMDVWSALSAALDRLPPALFVTADDQVKERIDLPVLRKPIIPADLYRALSRLTARQAAE